LRVDIQGLALEHNLGELLRRLKAAEAISYDPTMAAVSRRTRSAVRNDFLLQFNSGIVIVLLSR
jgi:hypothetical protein